MRLSPLTAALCAAACGVTLHASILPMLHLDSATVKAFQDYVAQFEQTDVAAFKATGKLWIDDSKHSQADAGRPIVEPRENKDVASGSIHHYTGVIHVPGGAIEDIRRVMQDYPKYPAYFRPDVGSGSGERMQDSTPGDEHFHVHLLLTQSTFWMDVSYQSFYDTHYLRLDPDRWIAHSASMNIKELVKPLEPNGETYPEGDDHGFLWRTNTYWFVRQRNGGVDLEANSISLSRPSPVGLGWWGTKRAHDAVEKMLVDTKAAISRK